MKKLFAIILAAAMLLTVAVVPFSVSAQTDVLVDFDSLTGISTAHVTEATLNTDPAFIKQGNGSVKASFASPAGQSDNVGGMMYYSFAEVKDLSKYDHFEMDLYLGDALTNGEAIQINFFNTAIPGDDGFDVLIGLDNYGAGWHHLTINKPQDPVIQGTEWTSINKMRFTWMNYSQSSNATAWYFDNLIAVAGGGSGGVDKDGNLVTFDDIAGFSNAFNTETTVNFDSRFVKQGSGSLAARFSTPAGQGANVGGMVFYTFSKKLDLSSFDSFEMDVYFEKAISGAGDFQVNFINSSLSSDDGYNVSFNITDLEAGWHHFDIAKPTAPAISGTNWNSIDKLRFTWFNNSQSSEATTWYLDNLKVVGGTPQTDKYTPKTNGSSLKLCPFEEATGITGYANTDFSIVTDSTNARQGNAYLETEVTVPTGQSGNFASLVMVRFSSPQDLTGYTLYSVDFYSNQNLTQKTIIQLNFITDDTAGNQDGFNVNIDVTGAEAGWHNIKLGQAAILANKMMDSADLTKINAIRIGFMNVAQYAYEGLVLRFDNLNAGAGYLATFDSQGATSQGRVDIASEYDAYFNTDIGESFAIPVKTGWEFKGYYSETNGQGTRYIDEKGKAVHLYDFQDNATLYAYWTQQAGQYVTITAKSNNDTYGYVQGGGEYAVGSTVTLTPVAGPNCSFVKWDDGNTDNPRIFEATQTQTYTAIFQTNDVVIRVESESESKGTVEGGGTYTVGTQAYLSALAKSGYEFDYWQNKSGEVFYDNPLEVTVTGTDIYTAYFASTKPDEVTISVVSADTTMGTVSGGGTVEVNTNVTLTAEAKKGYKFVCWQNSAGTTFAENPLTFAATIDDTYTAKFAKAIDPATVISGDVNRDGFIKAVDAMITLQFTMRKYVLDDIQKWCADVDDDGEITSTDALLILQNTCGKRILPERHYQG